MNQTVISIIKLFFLAVSFGGYALFIFNKFKIKSELLPVAVFSTIGVVLYVSAILNLLSVVTVLIYISGFLLFAYSIVKYKTDGFKKSLSFGLIFFLLMCGYFVIYLRSARLYGYDDFSHWAMIIKELQLYDRLPNFSSQTIAFPTYPPMTALFSYYVTKFIGFGENKILMSHMFFTFAFATGIFVFTTKGKKGIVSKILATLSALLMLALYCSGTATLLVDTILPLAGVCNTSVIIYYRNNLKKASLLSFPILTCTILIKNSGLIFAGVNMLLLIFFLVKDINKKDGKTLKKALPVVLTIAVSLFMLVIWKSHVNMVFPREANFGHHAMKIENYKKNFNEKPQEQLELINNKFLNKSLDPQTQSNKIMIIFSSCALIAYLASRLILKKKLKGTFHALVCVWIFYVLYLIGIYGMYLFSMPPKEASSFVSFDRYVISSIIFIVGIFTIGFLNDLKNQDLNLVRYGVGILIICTILSCFWLTQGYKVFYNRQKYETSLVYGYDCALKNTPIDSDDSYLLYMPSSQWDYGFRFYLTKYRLFTTNFEIITKPEDDLQEKISQYDHFVIMQKDDYIEKYTQYQK